MRPQRALAAAPLLASLALAGCLGGPGEPAEPGEPLEPSGEARREGPNEPPEAWFDWSPAEPSAGQPVTFEDRSTDPDDGVRGRIWEFPDGQRSQMARVVHAFAAPGRYLVKLTVSDGQGQTDTAAREVLVLPARPAAPGFPVETAALAGPRPHVVVAVVDTGINPYHAVFRAARPLGDPREFLEGYPADAEALPLTLGAAYDDARRADDALWARAEVGKLYFVPGTRIVGAVSFGLSSFANAADNRVPVLDDDGHGTATASRVALAGPHVYLVAVEAGPEELDEALLWAAEQPWIDAVSVSIGPLANLPAQWPAARLGALRLATRDAWEQGKLVFAAAGNEPSLSTTSYLSGPPWIVSVGGALPEGHGDPGTAAKGMDLVSDYRPEVAKHDSTEATEPRAGTSFSAPTAAGAAAEALYEVRARLGWQRGIVAGKLVAAEGPGLVGGGLTNAELRAAMEGVARYWGPTEWSPGVGLPVLAPWAQMGWGYLGEEDAASLAEAVLSGNVPQKPAEAQAYMAGLMATREAMWG